MMSGSNASGRIFLKEILEKTDGIAIELGVWKGGTTKLLADYFSEVHAVDSWDCKAYYNTTEWKSYYHYILNYSKIYNINSNEESLNTLYEEVYQYVVKKLSHYPNVNVHRMTTDEFFKSFNISVDFIYIDASHSEEDVYRDLNNSWNILKEGGIMIGDDYGYENKSGVTLAWDKFVKEKNLKTQINSCQIMIYK